MACAFASSDAEANCTAMLPGEIVLETGVEEALVLAMTCSIDRASGLAATDGVALISGVAATVDCTVVTGAATERAEPTALGAETGAGVTVVLIGFTMRVSESVASLFKGFAADNGGSTAGTITATGAEEGGACGAS